MWKSGYTERYNTKCLNTSCQVLQKIHAESPAGPAMVRWTCNDQAKKLNEAQRAAKATAGT